MKVDISIENHKKKYNHGDVIIIKDKTDDIPCYCLYIETEVPKDKMYFDLEDGNVYSDIRRGDIVSVISFEDLFISRK